MNVRSVSCLRPLGSCLLLLAAWGVVGCGAADTVLDLGDSPDGVDEQGLGAGKADGEAFSNCELVAMLAFVNAPETTLDSLKAAGVHTRAAQGLSAQKAGPDGVLGTPDDVVFESPEAVDAVAYVGPVAMRQLVAAVAEQCAGSNLGSSVEVVFSPQEYQDSHLARIRGLIEQAQHSIDIAIYSFSDGGISEALAAAVQRGIRVRLVFETARADQSDPANTKSSRLEDLGVDVRYVNKIMHHKFIIIDGPRQSLDAAQHGILVTGSANWSGSAATRYDENTVFIQGHPEALLRYQRQFNLLWNYSRDLAWNPALAWFASMAIGPEDIVDEPDFDAIFTSDNFVVKQSSHGPTFSVVSGRNTVADRLVALIMSAKTSIHIASGHLRSRPVSEALMAKAAQDPQVEIRVYLDSQEYISSWYHAKQQRKLSDCLEAAGASASKHQQCLDKGFLFGYALKLAGIDVRYKYYAYRWHYSYAPQMHNKFVIIDHTTLASGSYNLSDNAEHATMENVAIYDAGTFGPLVAQFEAQFERLWRTGEGDRYDTLLDQVRTAEGGFPIVFPAMSLGWDEVTTLKGAIKANCPVINSDDYRKNPQKHLYCEL